MLNIRRLIPAGATRTVHRQFAESSMRRGRKVSARCFIALLETPTDRMGKSSSDSAPDVYLANNRVFSKPNE